MTENKVYSFYSNVMIRSSPSMLIPFVMSRDLITPARGDWTTISIFMAERTMRGWPFSTESPTLTRMSITFPGMGAPTSLSFVLLALGWMWSSCKLTRVFLKSLRDVREYYRNYLHSFFVLNQYRS